MHPPLDRPHPDCQDEIAQLQACHQTIGKYWGACNDMKTTLDGCLKKEKERHLKELNVGLVERKQNQQEMIRQAFGQKETFDQYLAKDADYQRAKQQQKK